jgi:hypothetical protein
MSKNEWLLTMDDIEEEPQLRDIVMNRVLGKDNMNPLSDYIVGKKLMIKKETELKTESHEYPWNTIDNHKKICDMIVSHDMKIYSNFDDENTLKYLNVGTQKIVDIIKHAFCVHASQELIHSFIVQKLQKLTTGTSLKWEYGCTVNFHIDIPKVIEVINWKNKKYLYAHQSFLDDITNNNRSVFMFVNYSELTRVMNSNGIFYGTRKIPPSNLYTEVVNDSLNDVITEALKEMTFLFREKIIFSNDNDSQLLLNRDDTNLLMIRNLIGDEDAFCYASKSDKILMYCLNDRLVIKCKYAATIDDFCFAVFISNFNRTIDALSPQDSPAEKKTGLMTRFPSIIVRRNFVLLDRIITNPTPLL